MSEALQNNILYFIVGALIAAVLAIGVYSVYAPEQRNNGPTAQISTHSESGDSLTIQADENGIRFATNKSN